jgi:hypothetical protein
VRQSVAAVVLAKFIRDVILVLREKVEITLRPMKKIATSIALASLILVVLAPVSFAACAPNTPVGVPCDNVYTNSGPTTVYSILSNIISIAFYILMFLAVLFIIFAAFKYLTAQGNPENLETAQRMLLYAVVAIVVGLLARSVPLIISSFVNNNVVVPGQ